MPYDFRKYVADNFGNGSRINPFTRPLKLRPLGVFLCLYFYKFISYRSLQGCPELFRSK